MFGFSSSNRNVISFQDSSIRKIREVRNAVSTGHAGIECVLEKKDLRDMQKDLETAPTALRGAVGQASMPKPAQAIGMGQQKYTNIPNPDSLHLRGPS